MLDAQKTNVLLRGRFTIRLVSSFTSLDSTASLHTNDHIFSFLVETNLVTLETSRTVILPPTVSFLWWGPLVNQTTYWPDR